jgi:N-methylhydantoinase A
VDAEAAALGVLRVLLARTVGAVRQITVERGPDPRSFSLLAFGGAGPLLGPLLARELGVGEVIVPVAPAAFSAWGMLGAEIVHYAGRTELRPVEEFGEGELEAVLVELEGRAREALAAQGVAGDEVACQRQLDLRYQGQEHHLSIPVDASLDPAALRTAFAAEHERRYGHVMDAPVQVLNARVRAGARPPRVELAEAAVTNGSSRDAKWQDGGALLGQREAWCFARGARVPFAVYDRGRLGAGDELAGPVIVDEGTSTTVVMSDQRVRVDAWGQLVIRGEAS